MNSKRGVQSKRKLCMMYSSRAWSLCGAAVSFLYSIVLDCYVGSLVTRTLKTE